MKYKVVFTYEHEYIVEADDEHEAVDEAEECLYGEGFEIEYDGCKVTKVDGD